jgi:poly(3-hydroxybutyrate) depolymerase
MEYDIIANSTGFMVLNPEDDYLEDLEGNDCFNTIEECYELIALDKAGRV